MDSGIVIPLKPVRPSSERLISVAARYGAAFTWGSSALNCSQRCPRAERMSALESSSPRFCFNPRSMASSRESGKTPRMSFAGTLPENGLTPRVPGMAWPGVLELDVVWFCANAAAPYKKTPTSRTVRVRPRLSLKEIILPLSRSEHSDRRRSHGKDNAKFRFSAHHARVAFGSLCEREFFDHRAHAGHFREAQSVLGVSRNSRRPPLHPAFSHN